MRVLFTQSVVWLLSIATLLGQPTYQIEPGREAGMAGSGVGLLGSSILIDRNVDPLTPEEIATLDAANIWKVDRWVTRNWSPPAQQVSDGFLFSSLVLPATLYLDQPARTEAGKVGLIALESMLLSAGLTNLTKVIVRRPRPFVYNSELPLELKIEKNARYSYFSGHTSLTATASFLTAKLYNDFYPDSNARPYVWASAALIPAVTGYLRIRGGKHYLTDVLTGYAIGALVGVVVPAIHKN